jgi:DNA-binding transcriptional ArsR family regulator
MTSRQLAFSDDVTANYHGGNPISEAANVRATRGKGADRLAIMHLLRACPEGLTCDELEQQLGMRHQTVSARLTELKKDKLVVVTGLRRTRTGSYAGINREVRP